VARQGGRGLDGRALGGAVGLLVAASLWPSLASAATLTVTTTDQTSATDCTLPAAIIAANINANFDGCQATGYGDDTINITATGTISLTSSVPGITSNIEINGPGAGQLDIHRQDGSGPFGILAVGSGQTATISGLTISNGLLTNIGQAGAGVQNSGTLTLDHVVVTDNHFAIVASSNNGGPAPTGGGIANLGTMTLRDSTVTGNGVSATNTGLDQAFADASGGGIINFGTLTVVRSAITDNEATASVTSDDGLSGAFAAGGGLRNWVTSGTGTNIRLSTLSGNSTSASAPAPSNATERGGGIWNFFGPLTLTSDTVAFNAATTAANLSPQATETVTNTIVSDPVGGPNCDSGAVETDGGFNLVFPPGCLGLTALNADPELHPLADNGGPTFTHELGAGSAAIDQGTGAGDLTDQRSLPRPVDIDLITNADDGSDIGALEAQDSDEDGVADGADSCPVLDGAGTASGCPAVARGLTLGYSARRERFKGKLTAPAAPECADAREVSVFRKTSGPDKRVGKATTKPSGAYRLTKHARRGKYYSTVKPETLPDVADCAAAGSPVLRVG
jgi:hypothetical protein